MDKKKINELVMLYFDFNPQYNRGVAFKAKAHDIISSYANKHNMSYEEIKACIESRPMCPLPVWDQFYEYWFKKKKTNNEEKSNYKKSINNSTNPDDWI